MAKDQAAEAQGLHGLAGAAAFPLPFGQHNDMVETVGTDEGGLVGRVRGGTKRGSTPLSPSSWSCGVAQWVGFVHSAEWGSATEIVVDATQSGGGEGGVARRVECDEDARVEAVKAGNKGSPSPPQPYCKMGLHAGGRCGTHDTHGAADRMRMARWGEVRVSPMRVPSKREEKTEEEEAKREVEVAGDRLP